MTRHLLVDLCLGRPIVCAKSSRPLPAVAFSLEYCL